MCVEVLTYIFEREVDSWRLVKGMASLEVCESCYHHLNEAWKEREGGVKGEEEEREGRRSGGRKEEEREGGGREGGRRVVGELTGRFLQNGFISTGATAVLVVGHEWNVATAALNGGDAALCMC